MAIETQLSGLGEPMLTGDQLTLKMMETMRRARDVQTWTFVPKAAAISLPLVLLGVGAVGYFFYKNR